MDQPADGSSATAVRTQRTLTIPIRIEAGKVAFAFGKRMPALVDGTRGELVVSVDSVVDRYLAKLLQADQSVDLLPIGSLVLIAVHPAFGDQAMQRAAYQKPVELMKPGLLYYEAYIEQALGLRLAGARRPSFTGGACTIPALDNRRAISLNQAFTLLSERYEPDRHSHVGNAFKSGIYLDEASGQWRTFEDARNRVQARFEEYLTEQANLKGRKRRLLEPPSFAEWTAGERVQALLPF